MSNINKSSERHCFSDTHTQIDTTKDFFNKMAALLDSSSMDLSSNEYKLLFNIKKNKMADMLPYTVMGHLEMATTIQSTIKRT